MTRSAGPIFCEASPPCSMPAATRCSGTEAWRLEDDLELALARRAAAGHVSVRQPRHAQGLRTFTQAAERDRSGGAGRPLRAAEAGAGARAIGACSGRAPDPAAPRQHLRLRDDGRPGDVHRPRCWRDWRAATRSGSTSAHSSAATSCRSTSARPGSPSWRAARRAASSMSARASPLPIGRLALWLIEGYGTRPAGHRPPRRARPLRARHAQPEGLARRCRLQRERPAGELHRHRSQATPLTGRSARAWTSTGSQNRRLINCPITRPAAAAALATPTVSTTA